MALILNTNFASNPRAVTLDGGYVKDWQGVTSGAGWGNFPLDITQVLLGGPSPIASYGTYTVNSGNSLPDVERAAIEFIIEVSPGRAYTMSAYGRTSVAASRTIDITWYDTVEDARDHIGSGTGATSIPVAVSANVWGRDTLSAVAPRTARAAAVAIAYTAAPGNLYGAAISATGILIAPETAPNTPYSGEFFDGATSASAVATYEWLGTTNDSPSVQRVTPVEALTPPGVAVLTVIERG